MAESTINCPNKANAITFTRNTSTTSASSTGGNVVNRIGVVRVDLTTSSSIGAGWQTVGTVNEPASYRVYFTVSSSTNAVRIGTIVGDTVSLLNPASSTNYMGEFVYVT